MVALNLLKIFGYLYNNITRILSLIVKPTA